MSHGDLIIIRDALKEVIEDRLKLSFGFLNETPMNHSEFQEFIDEMVNHLHHKT